MLSYRTTTHTQRVAIIQRHQTGASYHQIAQEYHLSYYTVRKWRRAFRDQGWEGICTGHASPQGAMSTFHPLVRYVALRLKRQHPGWGLDKLLLELERHPSLQGLKLPKRSTLHRYYQQFAPRLTRHRPARNRRPTSTNTPVAAVHDCWQMDFKGEVALGDVGKVKPFVVCDAFSSAPLATIIHPGKRGGVTMRDVQRNLRTIFTQWGLPQSIRMDRDPIWVGSSRLEFPSVLLLWFIGLGITPIINRAHRPTDNAQVERCNGIWYEQVARGQRYSTLAEVQQASDHARHDRLFHLPSGNVNCDRQAPMVALPQLRQPRVTFTPVLEAHLFDIQRVYNHLSLWQWQRTIDSTGQLSLGGFNRRIGYDYAGQVVKLHFDPTTHRFVACHLDGNELKQFDLPSITPELICGTGMLE